jgi:hypothetical protein
VVPEGEELRTYQDAVSARPPEQRFVAIVAGRFQLHAEPVLQVVVPRDHPAGHIEIESAWRAVPAERPAGRNLLLGCLRKCRNRAEQE